MVCDDIRGTTDAEKIGIGSLGLKDMMEFAEFINFIHQIRELLFPSLA